MKKNLFFILISLALFIACNEEPVGQTPLDNIAPGKVSDINVTNIPGGAYRSSLHAMNNAREINIKNKFFFMVSFPIFYQP